MEFTSFIPELYLQKNKVITRDIVNTIAHHNYNQLNYLINDMGDWNLHSIYHTIENFKVLNNISFIDTYDTPYYDVNEFGEEIQERLFVHEDGTGFELEYDLTTNMVI